MAEQLSIRDTLTETRVFSKRAVVATVLVVLAVAALLGRYFHLQVIEHEVYRTQSDRNRIHARAVPPRRGLIFDRHGVVLADNRPIFNLVITRERAGDIDRTLATIGQSITLDPVDVERFRKRMPRQLPFEAVPLRFNLSEEEIARLAVNRHLLPGVEVEAELKAELDFLSDSSESCDEGWARPDGSDGPDAAVEDMAAREAELEAQPLPH